MSYLLALDAGTGSVRAVIFDLQGNQIAVGQAEWKHLSWACKRRMTRRCIVSIAATILPVTSAPRGWPASVG
jgi:sugar (pentulose or hexulose) kinase